MTTVASDEDGKVEAAAANEWPRIAGAKTLADQVYRVVRSRLVEGDIAPGTFIREPELCEAMAVSRTPIREALNRLVSEGFVERIPHRGFRVPDQAIESIVDLFPVLAALEVLAGELAFPNLGEAEIQELESVNESFATALLENDVAGAIRWNEEFHRLIANWSGNELLCEFLEDLRGKVRRLEMWDFTRLLREAGEGPIEVSRDEWARQHAEIIQAVREGNFDRARELLRVNRSLFFVQEIKQLLDSRSSSAAEGSRRSNLTEGKQSGRSSA